MSSPSASLDVQSFLDRHPFSAFQWRIFALSFLVVLLDGFDTSAIGYIAPSLASEWGASKMALAPVLSAALFGLAAGALLAGPLADRLGRKRVLVGAVLVFGLGCLASAFSQNMPQLVGLRFVTGLGLGAAMPNAVTLMSEYCPSHRRATITNTMFCGFPLGAALGGFLAAWMIPHLGWRSVLVLGGIAPLLLVLLMAVLLPESARYMVAKKYATERIRAVLRRISESAAQARAFTLTEAGPAPVDGSGGGLALVLSPRYLVGSAMLWIAYFMGLVIFYAMINWMPILFREANVPPQTATVISALFALGGVGAIFFGWLMDRFNANLVIATGYALTAVSVYLIGQSLGSLAALVLTVLLGGTLMNTAQSSMPALAAAFYPTQGRATGIAWMLGLGRFGGIAGSFLVAELASRQLGFAQIFAVLAVPALIATVALLVKQVVHPHAADAGRGAGAVAGH